MINWDAMDHGVRILVGLVTLYVAWRSGQIHRAVNSTASRLAEEKTLQEAEFRRLVAEVARLTEAARERIIYVERADKP